MGDEEASRTPPQVSEKNLEECRRLEERKGGVFLCGKEVDLRMVAIHAASRVETTWLEEDPMPEKLVPPGRHR